MGYVFKIVLASSSPRRKELLEQLGVAFTVAEPFSDESSTDPDPRKRVVQNAESKVQSVSGIYPDSLIMGADTIVFLDGRFLGKPSTPEEAKEMLRFLSGRTHYVFSGVAVLKTLSGAVYSGVEETLVTFKELSPESIDEYVESGEPMDKAGAYAIQGGAEMFVERIDGSWSNVVGLPLKLLEKLLDDAQKGRIMGI